MIEIALRTRRGDFALDARLSAPGGLTALFGPSGAGKTSIVRAVAGLMDGIEGHVRIGGRTLFDSAAGVDVPVHQRRIGYVFQDARLFPHLSVRQNLRYGGHREEEAVIALLGLEALLDRRPAGLSGGEAQRVALGRALMSGPDLLLLDEPLAALDMARRQEIIPYLEALRDRGRVPMIYVSHAIAEVARLANWVALVKGGRIAHAGPVWDVLSDPKLMPQIGVGDAGAVLPATIHTYDAADDLTTLALSQGELLLPGRLGEPGARLRLRVPAQQIILSLDRPARLSAQNVLPVRIRAIEEGRGPGVAVGLACGKDRLLARITRKAARDLELRLGQDVFAIVKATAISRAETGPEGRTRGRDEGL